MQGQFGKGLALPDLLVPEAPGRVHVLDPGVFGVEEMDQLG